MNDKAIEAALDALWKSGIYMDLIPMDVMRAAISAYLDVVATRDGVARVITNHFEYTDSNGFYIDECEAASAVLALLRGEATP